MREQGDHGRGYGGRGRERLGKQNHEQSRGKKASFQWINSQIIAASENGGVPQLMATVMAHLPRMNLVNLSTAVHRIAKLTSNDMRAQEDIRQNPALDELLRTISSVLGLIDPNDAQPQSLSNVAWSLATMRLMNRPLVQIVVSLAVTNIARFKPFELSTMLWAFAKLTTLDQTSWFMKPIFQASAALIIDQVCQFSFRCLATTAWAFATARQRHARLFRSIATQMLPMVPVANCQEMANAAWAFATADFHDEPLFTKLAETAIPRLREFKPQELSNMLWGFATNGFFHEGFFTASSMVVQEMPLQAQHLANILWAFVRVRPHHPVTTTTILMLLPSCTMQLETFKPQEVSSTALAVAKAFGTGDDLDRAPSPVARPHQNNFALPSQVQDFFKYAVPWAMPRLREFSAQSLANTVSAFSMVRTDGDVALFIAVGKEVLGRYDNLEPTALLHLLKGFSSAPEDLRGGVVRVLAKALSHHIDNFRPQEIQTLSRICVSLLHLDRTRDFSYDELRSCCIAIANSENLNMPSLSLDDRELEIVEDTLPLPRLVQGHPNFHGAGSCVHENGSSKGRLLALETALSGYAHEGSLPSMPKNALFESDFHFAGRPPPQAAASHRREIPVDDFQEELEFLDPNVRDLSPHNRQIGVRPEIQQNYSGQQNWKSRRDNRHNPKAIKNQRVPIPTSYATLTAVPTAPPAVSFMPPFAPMLPDGLQASALAPVGVPAIYVPEAGGIVPMIPVPMALPDCVPWEEYDAAKEFQWRFSIKNSFFHVDSRMWQQQQEYQENRTSEVEDGATQRSSSLPNRVRRNEHSYQQPLETECWEVEEMEEGGTWTQADEGNA